MGGLNYFGMVGIWEWEIACLRSGRWEAIEYTLRQKQNAGPGQLRWSMAWAGALCTGGFPINSNGILHVFEASFPVFFRIFMDFPVWIVVFHSFPRFSQDFPYFPHIFPRFSPRFSTFSGWRQQVIGNGIPDSRPLEDGDIASPALLRCSLGMAKSPKNIYPLVMTN